MWPYCLALSGIFGYIQIILYAFSAKTPEHDWQEMDESETAQTSEITKTSTIKNIVMILKDSGLRKALLCIMIFQAAQQLSGINALFFYSGSIFMNAGVPSDFSGIATVGVGAVNIVGSLFALTLINKVGRITLFLTGLISFRNIR